ncbi:DUF3043 domain-containing protein [Pengzhenrongella frigida]|uniref:DUF3043 domain-containing protein n=1 Tax=Pengzhenrongella frigida TaxID=1259133 RepID=A0A4Q5N182_9MICO|nr:DUF3043 domain-containing protein [Cellulomonas sp. HLT2-17]RYV50297.1 DUF3043 domain-containing protein [Cellulomonas sp. HLT2-17]
MLFRSKSNSAQPTVPEDDAAASRTVQAGKGHPTPKRKTSEALNKRPLVPADRKAAGKTARVAARAQRDREYQAMQTGDEKYLPAKDKGPVRRYVRDHVDARWNLGEFFLPIAMVFVVMTFAFATNAAVSTVVVLTLYVVVLVTVIDAFVMWRGLKKRILTKFGADTYLKGLAMYAVMRGFQIRRARLPKPQVKHGEYPV